MIKHKVIVTPYNAVIYIVIWYWENERYASPAAVVWICGLWWTLKLAFEELPIRANIDKQA